MYNHRRAALLETCLILMIHEMFLADVALQREYNTFILNQIFSIDIHKIMIVCATNLQLKTLIITFNYRQIIYCLFMQTVNKSHFINLRVRRLNSHRWWYYTIIIIHRNKAKEKKQTIIVEDIFTVIFSGTCTRATDNSSFYSSAFKLNYNHFFLYVISITRRSVVEMTDKYKSLPVWHTTPLMSILS